MEGLKLNWLGKFLSIAGTIFILYFLPRVNFRAAVVDGSIAINYPAIILTGFIGLIEGWMRERSGSLVAPILFHNAFNVSQSFV